MGNFPPFWEKSVTQRDGVRAAKKTCSNILSESISRMPMECTQVDFASFIAGGFTTITVINPPERKLAKRISVECLMGKRTLSAGKCFYLIKSSIFIEKIANLLHIFTLKSLKYFFLFIRF